ncbi:SpvB/TcaC N-terminal domain-containing protein, partial [Streptomyces sp. NPDC057909]|uniref:SpvB/TcaC N-terminal domain-containing protein n=1 Tax=Streptomyces sp. NPDC057909 TaxID=3346277 RepID=UPI0036E547FF
MGGRRVRPRGLRPPLPGVAVVTVGALLATLAGQGVQVALASPAAVSGRAALVSTPPELPSKTLSGPDVPVSVATDSSAYVPGASRVGSDGSYSYTVPLAVPQGRLGVQPSLSLEYSSGGGNGLLGAGWSLAGLSSISRCAKTRATEGMTSGVGLDTSDPFCLNGQKLITVKGRDNSPKSD